jgi:light-harvesting complex 1 beta chain
MRIFTFQQANRAATYFAKPTQASMATKLLLEASAMANLSGLTDAQAKEFHEHWKHGTWSWVMIASAVHVVTWIYQPWF